MQRLSMRGIIEYTLFAVVQTDPCDKLHRALKVVAFFTIELQESPRIFQHFLPGRDFHEELRNLGPDRFGLC